jgi:hypothetical protein
VIHGNRHFLQRRNPTRKWEFDFTFNLISRVFSCPSKLNLCRDARLGILTTLSCSLSGATSIRWTPDRNVYFSKELLFGAGTKEVRRQRRDLTF